MRLALMLLAIPLILAACGPVYTAAPTGGDVLPAEAQRVIDRATATAGAVATQAAQATATGQSARETATAASLGTLGALQARQTEAGVSMTLSAAQAQFTATAIQNARNFQASQAWATPTAAALRAQATYQAAEISRQLENGNLSSQFWQTIRFIFAALLVVGGLSWIAVTVIDRVSAIRVARMRELAAIAQAAFRVLPPGHWAEYQPGDGYRVYTLPGQLDAPATVIENAAVDHDHHWKVAELQAIMYAAVYGWTFEALGPEGINVMDRPDWDKVTDHLRDCGQVAKRPRSRTRWADEVTADLAREAIRRGLSVPYPNETAPEVHSPRCTEAQLAQTAQKHRLWSTKAAA